MDKPYYPPEDVITDEAIDELSNGKGDDEDEQ